MLSRSDASPGVRDLSMQVAGLTRFSVRRLPTPGDASLRLSMTEALWRTTERGEGSAARVMRRSHTSDGSFTAFGMTRSGTGPRGDDQVVVGHGRRAAEAL